MPDYDTPTQTGDLAVYFTPMTYRQLNEINRVQYEDQKIMQIVNNSETSEQEKIEKARAQRQALREQGAAPQPEQPAAGLAAAMARAAKITDEE
jgi:hypothetical protein